MSRKRNKIRPRSAAAPNTIDIRWDNYSRDRALGRSNNPTVNQQALTERMYIRVLSEMCMNRFVWKGLPNSIDPRYMEKVLFTNSLVVFFPHKETGRYLCLRGSGAEKWDIYDTPTQYIVTANTIINSLKLTNKECIPIWGNYMRMPDIDIVLLYAMKLANIDRTIEIITSNMRTSRLITATQDEILTYQNINRQIDEGVKTIIVKKGVDVQNNIQALDMAPDAKLLPAAMSAKKELWNECLTLLGVNNNAGEDKKERLVSDEVDANSDQVLVHRATSLKARREAAAKINRKYKYPDGTPLDISVEYVNDQVPEMPSMFGGF